MSTNHFDVVIIGSGAGGGTLAWKLAPTGKRILILERGKYVPRERDNWDSKKVILESKYHVTEEWYDRALNGFHPGAHYNVGGNTKFYGAALLRMRERDFGEVVHHGGVSPAWPISYAELEPYYTQAEHLYFVHGERGADPTDPRASADYRFPRMSHEPRIQELSDDLARLGLRPFHVPIGVMIDEADPNASACIRCGTCDGFPCLVNAKADAQVVCVDPALRHPNVSLLTGALVTRLDTSASGREVSAIHVERDGAREVYTAGVVVVSAGAINSAALLLRSANERHPRGLANGSDQVGRNYMAHVNSMMLAISKRPNPTVFQKTLALNDFYFGTDGFEHPMGHISFVGKSDEYMLAAGAPRIVPGLTLELMAKHSLDFWMTTEDLPDPDNRVTLTDEGGIQLAYDPNNLTAHSMLQRKLKSMLEHIGCEDHLLPHNFYVGKRIPLAGVAHQNGTARFGRDPRTSVLDENCKAHELDNLYVVDGSFFPSSSAVNPALTIMANALRVGDHLTARLR
ncbi:MAG: GMC family oxidoreductase [Deltaproteobacteria bacterium]|jgi:choline dehydrogenase-like flavoprotein|nr:GMC family oxidoreductase [Deltaproteobacteria bacterium]